MDQGEDVPSPVKLKFPFQKPGNSQTLRTMHIIIIAFAHRQTEQHSSMRDLDCCLNVTEARFGSLTSPSLSLLLLRWLSVSPVLKITSFSVRDINCCCLTEDHSVYTWGWDLGEFPTKLQAQKPPAAGAGPAAATSSSVSATKPVAASSKPSAADLIKFDKITLGHTRMLLMT
jgi:hypothetical protein